MAAEAEVAATDGAATDASERASFLADLAKSVDDAPTEAKPAEVETTPTEAEAGADEADSDDSPAADAEPVSEPDAVAARDPGTAKRLEAVQKAERRAKEQLAKERTAAHADIDARVAKLDAEWGPRIRSAEAFESLRPRVRYNTVAVLRELGLTDDDFESAAQQLYAHSKAAGIKPEHRAAAERASREREHSDELAATQKRLKDLEGSIAQRDEQAKQSAAAERYLSSIEKAVVAATPLAKHFLVKTPDKTRGQLAEIALALLDETGAQPSPGDVVARYETVRRAELEELGVDVGSILKAAPVKPGAVEVKPKVAGKLAVVVKPVAKPAAPKTDAEDRAEFLEELRKSRAAEAVDA